MDNNAMYKLSYGLFVLSANENGKDNACIINTATQVTSTPNRISIAVNKSNYTHDMIMNTKKFVVSTISEAADFEVFKRFGFQSGRDVNKFEGYTGAKRCPNGIMCVTEGTNAYIAGYVESTVDLGTHTLFIAQVTDAEVLSDASSATYNYYQSNIKPKPKKEEAPSGKTVWVCKVCGYEYEGEELPEDYTCPICNHPASDFEKVIR